MPLPSNLEMVTDRLTIRLVERTDLAPLLEIYGDDRVTRYLSYPSWKSMADAQAWFERAVDRWDEHTAARFVVVQKEHNQVIGTCLLTDIDQQSARAETGYVLGREYWGRGYMLEAMQAFVRFAFETLRLRRLEAELDPRNSGSIQLLDRLGFAREGLLRKRWDVKGEVTDSAIYGLLREEWAALLPAGNSSPTGRAR